MADLRKDTVLFCKERRRMCTSHESCDGCTLFGYQCTITCSTTEEGLNEIIDAVQKWHDEHPQKTYLMDFKEKLPNAFIVEDGKRPYVCRNHIYGSTNCGGKTCIDCWNEVMKEEYERSMMG